MNDATNRIRLALTRETGFQLDIDLQLPAQGICVLYGPSGCGKTTVLRCVAGLERAPQATIEIAGASWQDSTRGSWVPTWQRPVGYVFQEAGLFDHLDVKGNLAYGRKRVRGTANPDDSEFTLEQAIDLMGIRPLLSRRPHALSGGERQRVAIVRALATRPRLLLLDEPLSALDASRRRDILPWLERLRDEWQVPMLYVTHSSEEMVRLADTLVLMDQGRVSACGPVAQVLQRTDLAATQGDEAGVLLHGQVCARETQWHLMQVRFGGGSLWLRDTAAPIGQSVRVRVLARDVSVATQLPQATSVQNLLPCTVMQVAPDAVQAGQVMVTLACNAQAGESQAGDSNAGEVLLARITARAAHALALVPGLRVWAQLKAAALVG
jgi:molybdate transport system ATP-binding protein